VFSEGKSDTLMPMKAENL